MQNYFRSSAKLAITAGLFLGYGSAFASEKIEHVSLNELETSLANEPLRAPSPFPSRDKPFINGENAYVEKDSMRQFLKVLETSKVLDRHHSSKKDLKSGPHRNVRYNRTIRQKNKV